MRIAVSSNAGDGRRTSSGLVTRRLAISEHRHRFSGRSAGAAQPELPPATLSAPDSAPTARYCVGRSVAECATIDYGCPKSWRGFEDGQGCGCAPPDEAAE